MEWVFTKLSVCTMLAEVLFFGRKLLVIYPLANIMQGIDGFVNLGIVQILSFVVFIADIQNPQTTVFCKEHAYCRNRPVIYVFNKQLVIAKLQTIFGK